MGRYAVRHYVLFRGDNEVYEVDPEDVRITDEAAIWPKDATSAEDEIETDHERTEQAVTVRAHDQRVLEVMYPSLRPRLSARSETFYWKGPLLLVDGTEVELRVLELEDDEGLPTAPG